MSVQGTVAVSVVGVVVGVSVVGVVVGVSVVGVVVGVSVVGVVGHSGVHILSVAGREECWEQNSAST